jgi:hypothetical protein
MYAAVIIETRKVESFGKIVRDHMQHLPVDWKLEVYCSAANRSFVEAELAGSVHNISEVVINNIKDYNFLLMSVGFWRPLLKYDRVLLFQTDSGILRPGVEEFLRYAYIGAPWPFDHRGGNGGFSIRNPEAMIAAIEKYADSTPSLGLIFLLFRMKMRRIFIKNKTGKNAGKL